MIGLLRSVDLKLSRAKLQANQLIGEISQWTSDNPIKVRCEKREGNLGFKLILNDFTGLSHLDKWSLDAGECINNLRSSLDYLAYSLAQLKKDPPDKPSQLYFPICFSESEFSQKVQGCLQQLPNEASMLIKQIQPYQRDGSPENGSPDTDTLLLLRDLNNSDKHRVPIIMTVSPLEIGHKWSVEFEDEDAADRNNPPEATFWGGPLQPNCTLLEYCTNDPIKNIKGSFEYKAVIQIVNNGKVNEGKTYCINSTIAGLVYYTDVVVTQFRRFF